MDHSEAEFDYQYVLETCELQGQNVKKAIDGKKQLDSSHKIAYDNLKRLRRERISKNDRKFEVMLIQKRNLQELENAVKRQFIVNKEIISVQLKTTSLNSDLQKQSDDAMKKTAEMDENLQNLYTHFDEKTLEAMISEVSTDLLTSQDIGIHLHKELTKLVNTNESNIYAKYMISKIPVNKLEGNLTVIDTKKKTGEGKKNIQFLTNEIEKRISKNLERK